MGELSIRSETGRLRTVMIHLPGLEIEHMVPAMMNELLFDDILYSERAREEHGLFRRLLEHVADEVIEFADLLQEVLEDGESRAAVMDDLERQLGFDDVVRRMLHEADPETLTGHLIAGIIRPDVRQLPANPADVFLLPPLPNLFFQRDPAVVIGEHVALASMATPARSREPMLVRCVFRYHPRFRSETAGGFLFEHDPTRSDATSTKRAARFEGGDLLVASADTVVIGISERTRRQSIEELAAGLRAHDSEVRRIIVVQLPKQRSFMHLDTVFTIISEHECLIYEPAILPGEVQEVDVYQVDVGSHEVSYTAKSSLLAALKAGGLDLAPIPCGGPDDPIAQQREQWTDGANAFALAPGIIICYERNVRTAEQLGRAGYEIVYGQDLLLGRTELELDEGKRYAIQLEAHELSRARGGPRCMTMPLTRD